jgi:hypothetical protein
LERKSQKEIIGRLEVNKQGSVKDQAQKREQIGSDHHGHSSLFQLDLQNSQTICAREASTYS